MVDYPGQLAMLVFTCGCDFRCGFCHNADLIESWNAKTFTVGKLREKMARWREDWVAAVTITGGEPTIHDGLPDTIQLFREAGFKVKLDTNGSRPEMVRRVLPMVDYVAMDIKCHLDGYPDFVKFKNVDLIRESIGMIIADAKDYEFRTTVLESFHTDEVLRGAGEAIRGAKRWIFQPFIPQPHLPDPALREMSRTKPSFLEHCVQVASPYVQQAIVR